MTDVLDAHARRVADAVLAEEGQKRNHLVVALSGAHAYGFPSPDSDLDLKGLHVAPTHELLGLREATATFDRTGFVEGVEIDYTSNELGLGLRGLLKGNGNFLERVLGQHLMARSPLCDELAPLAKATVSKRYYRHYLGFAMQQRQAFEKSEAKTAKKLLYVLRTALTGAHLMRTGELRVDLNDNLREYGFDDAEELIERKKVGERTGLDERAAAHWFERVQAAFSRLELSYVESPLPDDAPNEAELEAWLVDVRLRSIKP